MKNPTKPQAAWGITVAAALDLVAFVFLAAANSEPNILYLFGACEFFLILGAVNFWKEYFEDLIEMKLGKAEESSKD